MMNCSKTFLRPILEQMVSRKAVQQETLMLQSCLRVLGTQWVGNKITTGKATTDVIAVSQLLAGGNFVIQSQSKSEQMGTYRCIVSPTANSEIT